MKEQTQLKFNPARAESLVSESLKSFFDRVISVLRIPARFTLYMLVFVLVSGKLGAQKFKTFKSSVDGKIALDFSFNGKGKMMGRNMYWGGRPTYYLMDSARMNLIRKIEAPGLSGPYSKYDNMYSFISGDKIVEIYSNFTGKPGEMGYVGRVLDLNGNVIKDAKLLHEGKFKSKSLMMGYQAYYSANNKYMAFISLDGVGMLEAKAVIYDSELNQLKSHTFRIKSDNIVDYNGNVSNTGKFVFWMVSHDDQNTSTTIDVSAFDLKSNEVVKHEIEKEIIGVCDARSIMVEKKSTFLLAGTYLGKDPKHEKIYKQYPSTRNGFFFLKLNLETFALQGTEFRQMNNADAIQFNNVTNDENVKQKELKWVAFLGDLKGIRLKDDGAVNYVIEYSVEEITRKSDGSSSTKYKASDLHFVTLKDAGSDLEIVNVKKFSQSEIASNVGCLVWTGPDRVYVFYNAHSKGFEGGVGSQLVDHKDVYDVNVPCVGVAYEDGKGTTVKAVFDPSDKSIVDCFPVLVSQDGESVCYIKVRDGLGKYDLYRVLLIP